MHILQTALQGAVQISHPGGDDAAGRTSGGHDLRILHRQVLHLAVQDTEQARAAGCRAVKMRDLVVLPVIHNAESLVFVVQGKPVLHAREIDIRNLAEPCIGILLDQVADVVEILDGPDQIGIALASFAGQFPVPG